MLLLHSSACMLAFCILFSGRGVRGQGVRDDQVQDDGAATPPSTAALPVTEVGYMSEVYLRKEDESGKLCLLADFSPSISIKYTSKNGTLLTKLDGFESGDSDAQWSGDCTAGSVFAKVTWGKDNPSTLEIKFNKDSKDWWADTITYSYVKSVKTGFSSPVTGGPQHVKCRPGDGKHFKTPLGFYHSCENEAEIILVGSDVHTDDNVTLILSGVRLWPFQVDESGKFADSKAHKCEAAAADRGGSEAEDLALRKSRNTAAVAVGICLALVTVAVIVGYAGRRYYLERISYSSMQ